MEAAAASASRSTAVSSANNAGVRPRSVAVALLQGIFVQSVNLVIVMSDILNVRFFQCWATVAVAASVLMTASPAQAQSTSCVEVIAAQAGIQPAILVDKCSGRTWQLVPTHPRRRGANYIWRPLQRADAPVASAPAPAVAAPPPAPKMAQPPSAASPKCFQFNGRTFCE